MPQRAGECRRLAIRARQEAAETTKPDLQKTFETIAHNWEALADQADWLDDKYASLAPLAPSAESRPMQQQQQQQIQAKDDDKKQE